MKQIAPRMETIGQVSLPIVVNLMLAVILFSTIAPNNQPSPSSALAPPPPPEPGLIGAEGARPLPTADFDQLLANVRATSSHDYHCEGPWHTSDGLLNWSCRTQDALVEIRGNSPREVSAIEITWFGFDETSTDLAIWAQSAQQADAERVQSGQWVQANIGSPSQTRVGAVQYRAGGARGVMTLYVTST